MAVFEYKESYKHLYAKKLLLKWLRELDEKQDGCSFGPISWRSNWGVHEELPFFETSDPYYFELSKGIYRTEQKHYKHQQLFDPKSRRGRLLFVPDIVIFHKGISLHLIEVIHKSAPSESKIKKIDRFFSKYSNQCNLWLITADYILNQCKKPTSLNFEHLQIVA